MKKIILSIDGMTCSACSNGLEKYLSKRNGILDVSVNLVMANATVLYDDSILNQEKIENYIEKAGFKSLGLFTSINQDTIIKRNKSSILIYTILSIILMYISMGHKIGLMYPKFINPNTYPINYGLVLLVMTIFYIIYGLDIIESGIKNLIHKMPNMDTLITLGVSSSFLYSIYCLLQVIKGNIVYLNHFYFESSAIVIYFTKLGRYLDSTGKNKTKEAIKKLVEVTPEKATIISDSKEKVVTLDEIRKGNIIIARPGEKIAVDGEIIEGKSHLDESFITGESIPSLKKEGDKVIAGSLNYDGIIKYKAEKIGKESTISEIVRLVVEASNTKVPIAKIADNISSYFVPGVMLIAILTFIISILIGISYQESLQSFITVLVIACPCSLGLATPLAVVVGEGLCAGSGILVKKSEILETASKIDTIVFDKTGTITSGKLNISKIINYSNIDNKELLRLVASIENNSFHPIASTFKDYTNENNVKTYSVENYKNLPGFGLIGTVNQKKMIVGNQKIVSKYQIENKHLDDEQKLREEGCSILYVIIDNKIFSLIGVKDIPRNNTKNIMIELQKRNIKTIMLTGDNEETADKIGKEVSISKIIANVLPKEKRDIIKNIKKEKRIVAMCGDGINDSPALSEADIGISIKNGTDIAKDSADVLLMSNNLKSVIDLIDISKKTVRKIKQNLFWAFFYNILMIPIAMGILKPFGIIINPIMASLAMVLSSLTVIGNTLLLKK